LIGNDFSREHMITGYTKKSKRIILDSA